MEIAGSALITLVALVAGYMLPEDRVGRLFTGLGVLAITIAVLVAITGI